MSNDADFDKMMNDAVKYSIVDPGIKKKFLDIFGVKDLNDYIALIASKNNMPIDDAKKAMLKDPFHAKICFILA